VGQKLGVIRAQLRDHPLHVTVHRDFIDWKAAHDQVEGLGRRRQGLGALEERADA